MEQGHISTVFDKELDGLRDCILAMGGKVEQAIANSIKSLVDRDSELATLTIERDHEINRDEVLIDEKCLEILALRQPTARDLRFITFALKIVTDLERIGDKCANIAKQAIKLNGEPLLTPYINIPRMAIGTEAMVREALNAFVNYDSDLALKVCKNDVFINELNGKIQRELMMRMMEDPANISRSLKITYISKSLERIADHATNIAEMVIFMVKGKDVRHT